MQYNRNWWMGGVILVAVLLVGGIYQINRDEDPKEAEKDLENGALASLIDSVDLKPFAQSGLIASRTSADLSEKLAPVDGKIAFGDLTADGEADAAIVVEEKNGNASFFSLAVLKNEDGASRYLDGMYLGDRIQVESLEIKDGIITVKYLSHRTNDYLNSPTLERVESFRLMGEKLVSA